MKTKNKIISKYIFKDDYNPKYVNGAFGGVGPQGEFIINFYLERVALPNSQTFELNEGKVVKEIEDSGQARNLSKASQIEFFTPLV